MPDTVTRPYFCVKCDDWSNHPTHEHRKTTRRRGKRRKFQPGFYLTEQAEKVLGEIPSGKVSEFINQAIVLLSKLRRHNNA